MLFENFLDKDCRRSNRRLHHSRINESTKEYECCICDNEAMNRNASDEYKTFNFTASCEEEACKQICRCYDRVNNGNSYRDIDRPQSIDDVMEHLGYSNMAGCGYPYIVYIVTDNETFIDDDHFLCDFAIKLSKSSRIYPIIDKIIKYYGSFVPIEYGEYDINDFYDAIKDEVQDTVTDAKKNAGTDVTKILKKLIRLDRYVQDILDDYN